MANRKVIQVLVPLLIEISEDQAGGDWHVSSVTHPSHQDVEKALRNAGFDKSTGSVMTVGDHLIHKS